MIMEDKRAITNEIDSFVKEASDDYVGLWQIIRRARHHATNKSDIQYFTFAVVKGILDRQLAAGNLTKEGGFEPWRGQHPGEVINRIQQEWQELGHDPTIDDIAWFALAR